MSLQKITEAQDIDESSIWNNIYLLWKECCASSILLKPRNSSAFLMILWILARIREGMNLKVHETSFRITFWYILKLLLKIVFCSCFFVTMPNNTYQELEEINQEVEQKYSKIVNLLLDTTEDISQVELILTSKCFNSKEVIDLISECDFQLVLNNAKVRRVVTDFWKGPYETEFFMNNCYAYAQIRELFIDSKKFFGYKPAGEYAFSVGRLWRQKSQKMIFEEIEQSKNLARYANYFHFKQWDKSLSTKYFIEAIFVIIGSLSVLYLASHSLSLGQEAQPIVDNAIDLIYKLETEGISDSERLSTAAQLLPIAEEAERKIREVFISIDRVIFINLILTTYVLKLINQYIINSYIIYLQILN